MPFAQHSSGRTSRWGSSSVPTDNTDPYTTDKLQKQIDNAKTRISDSGFTQQDADPRNWFEKSTNLPQGQNWFFDTLEILGRPGSAVKNVIDKSTGPSQTESVREAAWRGFSGRDRVSGVDLARDRLGIDNKPLQFILGTGLDIGTDPTSFIPAGVLAKGVKTGVGFAAKPVKTGYNALENVAPKLKSLREDVVQPFGTRVKDSVGYMFNPDYKIRQTLDGGESDFLKNTRQQTDNSRRYMQEQALENLGRTARDSGGIGTGADVGRIMEQPLRQFEDVKAYEFPDGLRRTENKQDLFTEISNNRSAIKEIGKGVNATRNQYSNAIGEFATGINQTDAEIHKLYMGFERQAGKELDTATRSNIRDARRELQRVESQINNFDGTQESMLRNFKKQIKDSHQSNFDIIRRVKEVAPNGVKGVNYREMPKGLRIRHAGKAIDEVANELGYQYADELIQDLKHLNSIPRRLDDATLSLLARQEMQRTGAIQHLEDTYASLQTARTTLQQSISEIRKQAPKTNAARATEQAFASLSQHPEYVSLKEQRDTLKNQLDSLKQESKTERQGKIDQIKQREEEIQALREAAKNPAMMQKEIPRPERQTSTDPKIQKAAKKLVESNAAIRQFAEQQGIDIPELEGYMTHVWSQEERKRRLRVAAVDKGMRNAGNPNKSILNTRQLTGSAEDINDKLGRNFFEPNAYFATGIGQKRLIDYIHAVNFRKEVLSNPDFAKQFVKGMDVPADAEVIDVNNYKFLKESGDVLDGVVPAEQIGGQYIVTKQAKMLLDRYQKANTDEGTKAFLRAYDGIQSFWKRSALFSLGYHFRNQAGAMFNNYVAGMNPYELTKFTTEGFREVARVVRGKESALFNEYRQQGLSSSALSQVEFARYGQEPEDAIQKTVQNMSRTRKGKVLQGINPLNAFQTSQTVGNFFDQSNRFALYKWAREKKGMSAEEAAAKVREVQFDYSHTTPFEQNVMTRVMPFYRWMKFNIPFQIRKFVDDPRKYSYLNKLRLNAQDAVGLNEDNIPDYMKENFSVPLYGENGKGRFLGLNLPLGDLTKLSRPGKTLIDSFTPLIKTPAELALNYNMFRGKPIEKFAGQEKQYQIGDMEFSLPMKGAYAVEQATGQIGRGLSGFLQKPESQDQDTQVRMPSLGISSLSKKFDAEQYAYYEKLNELKQLQDLMMFIEQQTGDRPRTVNEIKKAVR